MKSHGLSKEDYLILYAIVLRFSVWMPHKDEEKKCLSNKFKETLHV